MNRSATCITIKGCLLLEISGSVFREIMGEEIRQLTSLRVLLMSKILLFKPWDWNKVAALRSHTKMKKLYNGEHVYSIGEHDENIYIVVSGELELYATDELMRGQLDVLIRHRSLDSTNKSIQELQKLKVSEKYLRKKKKLPKRFTLLRLAHGNYFGDENGFDNSKKEYSVVVVTSHAHLLVIHKEVFIYN